MKKTHDGDGDGDSDGEEGDRLAEQQLQREQKEAGDKMRRLKDGLKKGQGRDARI